MDKFEQLIAEAKRVTLRPEERTKIWEGIRLHIRERPTAFAEDSRPLLNFFSLLTRSAVPVAALAVIMGIALISKNSLPGSRLYPVKVAFFESIPEILSFGGEARANWESIRAENRLAEAEALAEAGNLDPATAARISSDLDRHIARIDSWAREAENERKEARENADALALRMRAIRDSDLASLKTQVAKADVDVKAAAEAARETAEAAVKTPGGNDKLGVKLLGQGSAAYASGDFRKALILYLEAHQIAK